MARIEIACVDNRSGGTTFSLATNQEPTMSELIAIVYPNQQRAMAVLEAVQRLEYAHLVDLEDACVVTKDDQGKVRLHQTVNLASRGAVGGAFWGSLVGLLFLNPLLGLATGAAAGAAAGALTDYGISDRFMRSLAQDMGTNTSAIFILVRRAPIDKVERELAMFGGRLLHTSLSSEQERRLGEALAAASPASMLPAAAALISPASAA